MASIKTIIVDDEQLGRKLIREFLSDHEEIDIIAECKDAHEAYDAIQKFRPDLVFLDIQMPEINGFELIEMLDELPLIIFSTAYDQFAIKAFEVNAVDYLLKPYDADRFNVALERAVQQIHSTQSPEQNIKQLLQTIQQPQDYLNRILIKQSGKIVIISCHEILWIQAMDDYVDIHTKSDSYLIQQSMNYLESRLNPDQFIRAHRSFIVNIDAVKEIASQSQTRQKLIMKDGKEIFLSRTGLKKLKRFSI